MSEHLPHAVRGLMPVLLAQRTESVSQHLLAAAASMASRINPRLYALTGSSSIPERSVVPTMRMKRVQAASPAAGHRPRAHLDRPQQPRQAKETRGLEISARSSSGAWRFWPFRTRNTSAATAPNPRRQVLQQRSEGLCGAVQPRQQDQCRRFHRGTPLGRRPRPDHLATTPGEQALPLAIDTRETGRALPVAGRTESARYWGTPRQTRP